MKTKAVSAVNGFDKRFTATRIKIVKTMQNIKICPKCNQIANNETTAFCPFDGNALVEMEPVQNQKAEQPTAIQPQGLSPSSPTMLDARRKFLLIAGLSTIGISVFVMATINEFKKNFPNGFSDSSISSTGNTVKKEPQPLASTSPTPLPPTLSSKENLEAGKNALSNGNLSSAKSYLSAIPKEAKEFASAKQYLATLEKRERRKSIEDELSSVESEQAGNEKALNLYESMEGSIGKGSYLNALKEKGKLQLRHIELERKLKSMP